MDCRYDAFEWKSVFYKESDVDYHSETPHELDFSKYPSRDQQLDFLEAYVTSQLSLGDLAPFPTSEAKEAYLHEFQRRVESFVPCSHLLWGLWGIFRGATEKEGEFDYIGYGLNRLEAFFISHTF